jgi:predicted MFS family arabinose efflux permease
MLLVAFGIVELRQASPMFDLNLFRIPTFAGAQITAFAISSGMFAQFLYLAIYLESVLGHSAVWAGVRFLPLSLVSFVVAPIAGRLSARIPVRFLLGGGLATVGLSLLLMWDIKLDSGWTTLLAGFIVGGIGIGLVNAPLASTAVSVVEPRRAGMASGINNTFRQVGIATGIAGLGAIFQSRIASHLAASGVPAHEVHPLAQAISSGGHFGLGRTGKPPSWFTPTLGPSSFISGLNEILLVASFVLFAGAVLAFLLVRRQDFVASGPAVAPEAG